MLACTNMHINITCARQWLSNKPKTFFQTRRRQLEYYCIIILVSCSCVTIIFSYFHFASICLKLNNLIYISLCWKCCSAPGPPPQALPQDPNGALKRPHAARLAHVAHFDFLHFAKALQCTQPSLSAHGHPQVKLRHWASWKLQF